MGTYDTIHAGTRCGQTKALGRGLGNLVAGDHAWLHPAPLDAAAYQAHLEGRTGPVVETFQVQMPEGGWLLVRASVIEGWFDAPAADVPKVDNLGHPLPATAPATAGAEDREHLVCGMCADVRTLGAAETAARRDRAIAERRALRQHQRVTRIVRDINTAGRR